MLSQHRLPSWLGESTNGWTILPAGWAWSKQRESAYALRNGAQSARCPAKQRTNHSFARPSICHAAPRPHLREHCALATWGTARALSHCLSYKLLSAVMNHLNLLVRQWYQYIPSNVTIGWFVWGTYLPQKALGQVPNAAIISMLSAVMNHLNLLVRQWYQYIPSNVTIGWFVWGTYLPQKALGQVPNAMIISIRTHSAKLCVYIEIIGVISYN